MQNKPTSKKRGRRALWEIRLMITALAVAATLGFWNLFSKQMVLSQAVEPQPIEPTQVQQPVVLLVELPPMPTLIPALDAQDALASMPASSLQAPSLPVQTLQTGAKVLLGGSAPQAPRSAPARRSAPAPVTTTRSSR